MKTLELKDIAAYLPYGLKVIHDKHIGTDTLFEMWYHPIRGDERVVCGVNTRLDLSEIKPILRPMSALTKEITHKGEKFVPMDELLKISSRFKFDICGVLWFDGAIWLSDAEAIIGKFAEWMFDYRGLISAGLAVDVNTLDKNPYEV